VARQQHMQHMAQHMVRRMGLEVFPEEQHNICGGWGACVDKPAGWLLSCHVEGVNWYVCSGLSKGEDS
jgi:hypothetical protein